MTTDTTENSPELESNLHSDGPDHGDGNDIIPIPILIGVFVVLWVIIVALLMPGWAESMRGVIARREARNGNYTTAESYYKQLVAIRPNNASYLGELAYVQNALKQYDEAVKNYKRATEVLMNQPVKNDDERGYVPPSPDHYSAEIGSAYMGAGNYTEARRYLEQYLSNVDRQHGMSHFYLAQIFLKEGQPDKAAIHLAAAKDGGVAENMLKPIRQGLLESRLPAELR